MSFKNVFKLLLYSLVYMHLSQGLWASQVQDFEANFRIVSAPEEFLPNWSANEVRGSAARVFQANNQGRNGSRALAVQPISGFNALIFIRVDVSGIEEPKVAFFARTGVNGTGTRPVDVFMSFSRDGGDTFQSRIPIGTPQAFPNATTAFRLFEVPIPSFFRGEDDLLIRLEVNFGAGTGSAARFFLDDFGVYDLAEEIHPLQLVEARMLNPYQLKLGFDRSFVLPELSQMQPQGWTIASIIQQEGKFLVLEIGQGLEMERFGLEIFNLQDKDGLRTAVITVEIDNRQARLGDVWILSSEQIRLFFSQILQASSIVQSSIFSVQGQSPASVELLENGYSVDLKLSQPLILGQVISIQVGPYRSLNGTLTTSSQFSFLYQNPLLAIEVRDDSRIDLMVREPIAFYYSDFAIREESSYTLSHQILENGRLIRLEVQPVLEELVSYELLVPLSFTKEGVSVPGFSVGFLYDRTPPEVVGVIPLAANRLLVIFSEGIDRALAIGLDQFRLAQVNASRIQFTDKETELIVEFVEPLKSGHAYQLGYHRIIDLFGNMQEGGMYGFVFQAPERLAFKDIRINELMPAPRAGNVLPNVEYVELFNRTDRKLALEGFQLANSRRSTQLPAFIMEPQSYVVLVPRNQVSLFAPYGSVVGVSNWPALLNSSDQVRLIDSSGTVIDSVAYTTSSFGGAVFVSGGYSLELVNPDILCDLPTNLRASTSPKRGTPGQVNAVFDAAPDKSPFVLERALMEDSFTIVLHFSKIIGDVSRIQIVVDPELRVQKISLGVVRNSLLVHFKEELIQGKLYHISVKRVVDCTGMDLASGTQSTSFIWPFEARSGEVVINELLTNPRSGAPRFVELYNTTDKYLNLQDWKLANLNTAGEIANRRILFNQAYILEPYQFLVFTTDPARLKQEYPRGQETRFIGLSSLPSYPIAGGNVVLLNSDESVKEVFTYSDKMHHRLLRDSRGVSLERLNPLTDSQNPSNWQSASSSSGFATPGFRNSHTFAFAENQEVISIHPEIFVPDAPGEQGFCTISYQLAQSGMVGSIHIYGVDGRQVKQICQNAIWGYQGWYIWEGVDDMGRKVRPGYYLVFAEIFDLNGNLVQLKKTVAVGVRF